MKLKVQIDDFGFEPTRVNSDDAGLDLYSPEDVIIEAGTRCFINTGVHVGIPKGYVGFLTSKSGLMKNHGITCRGTIDAGYVGSIGAVLFNHSDESYTVRRGDRITQLVILPIITPEIEIVDELKDTARGKCGFGSSGR